MYDKVGWLNNIGSFSHSTLSYHILPCPTERSSVASCVDVVGCTPFIPTFTVTFINKRCSVVVVGGAPYIDKSHCKSGGGGHQEK